ncbi:MAG: hypothetical protein LUD72_13580 [Bacteroidales bacterium]|nr:hypothetical protein [Bacteroidales bacterium]
MAKKDKKQEETENYEEFFESSECDCECECADCGSVHKDKVSPTIYRG